MKATLAWGSATDVGRVRQTNEDSVLAQPPIFLVADGMGGHANGEVASAIAVSEFGTLAARDAVSREDLRAAVERSNQRVLAEAGESGMGTTVSGMALTSQAGIEHWLVFNVGDSRVYRHSDGTVVQITHDHSEVQELVDQGKIGSAAARSHRLRNVVTRAIGSNPAPEIDSWVLPVVAGDRFLICSDGLVGELSDLAIGQTLAEASADIAASTLVARAVEAGGHDNVTVIVIDVVEAGSSGYPDEDTQPRLVVEV